MKRIFALLVLASAPFTANALVITPGDALASGPETGQAAIDAVILPLIAPSTELYKQDVGAGADVGSLAGSYETVYSNTPADPSDATITYVGGPTVQPIAYMLVKDGNQNPGWYLFNLTGLGWDGMETLNLTGFWPEQGAISHISLYGTLDGGDDDGGDDDDVTVPEPTALSLLGIGLLGMAFAARRRRLS